MLLLQAVLASLALGSARAQMDVHIRMKIHPDLLTHTLLELLPKNRAIVYAVSQDLGVQDYFTMHEMAASNTTGSTMVSGASNIGSEQVSIASCNNEMRHRCKQPIQVPVTTLDVLFQQQRLTHVDSLVIDTEGYDPLVLEGTISSLKSHVVRVLEFEYHGIGYWSKRGGHTLEATVRWLDHLGYDCFYKTNPRRMRHDVSRRGHLLAQKYLNPEGKNLIHQISGSLIKSLVPLTLNGVCWRTHFEMRKWSNVACIVRGGWERSAVEQYIISS
eukprot:scaffold184508_cov41-Tisochrysis_lutea.AAC.1